MVKGVSIVVVALGISVAPGCAQIPPERQLIQRCCDGPRRSTIGSGRPRRLTIEGEAVAPNAGQNKMPDSELPVWKVTEFKRTIDLANGRTRVQQVRTAQFMFAGRHRPTTTARVSMATSRYNVGADGNVTRAGEQAAAANDGSRCFIIPFTIVLAALDPSSMLTNVRQQGNEQLVDMTTAKGDVLTLGCRRLHEIAVARQRR